MKRTALTSLLLLGAFGCKAQSAHSSHDGASDTELTAREKVARMMAREQGPYGKHELSLFDGRIEGRAESTTKPRIECENEDDQQTCTVTLDMGTSETGKPSAIVCVVSTGLQPFGQQIHHVAREPKALAQPTFDAREEPYGLSGHFAVDALVEEEGQPTLMSLKLSTLYSHAQTFTCLDLQPGGKETFKRVVGDLFASLTFEDPAGYTQKHSLGYVKRQGNEAKGFRFVQVGQVDDETVQTSLYFTLEQSKEQWQTLDRDVFTLRDRGGDLSKYQARHWMHSLGPVVITAKPSEGGKLRIKVENGNKSNALEMTPRADISTEERMAPELMALARRRGKTTRYGIPGLDEDGDPTLFYSVLEHHEPGIVHERVVSHADFNKKTDEAPSELHVDAYGVVTRQVDADHIIELVHREGQPSGLRTFRTKVSRR